MYSGNDKKLLPVPSITKLFNWKKDFMRAFILSIPGKIQVIFIIGSIILLAFITASICSLFFDEHQLVTNTDLISSVYQVMGTIYAILLTFTLWGVWQSFSEAGAAVRNEAFALLDLVHMFETINNKSTVLRNAVLSYSTFVIENEWPALKNFTSNLINIRESNHGAAWKIIDVAQKVAVENQQNTVIFEQILTLLTRWLDARRDRILIARGDSAKALWPLLFTGALVLFSFHGLFVAKTLGIWIMLLFGASLVIGVTFYLIFTLDCPFMGALSIDSEPFLLITHLLKQKKDECIS